ncbi:MAG TPA: hypothetical protein VM328_06885, partial [Fimbriimonadaceae bacterium]|nr:hypothetical protein [Fimbriimonadaceae bacterium]
VWKENSEAAPSHTAVRETPRHSQRRRLVARNEAPASRGGAAISMRQTPVHSTDEPSPYSGMADLIEAAASMQPTPNDPPIVLVAGEADAMTGAHRAIEVETASNVLVGG